MIKDSRERINFMLGYDERNKYKPLMKEQQSVAEFDFYRFTKMAESHFQRAEYIYYTGGNYNEMCSAFESSWYYLLCAAECGELDFIDATGEQE